MQKAWDRPDVEKKMAPKFCVWQSCSAANLFISLLCIYYFVMSSVCLLLDMFMGWIQSVLSRVAFHCGFVSFSPDVKEKKTLKTLAGKRTRTPGCLSDLNISVIVLKREASSVFAIHDIWFFFIYILYIYIRIHFFFFSKSLRLSLSSVLFIGAARPTGQLNPLAGMRALWSKFDHLDARSRFGEKKGGHNSEEDVSEIHKLRKKGGTPCLPLSASNQEWHQTLC